MDIILIVAALVAVFIVVSLYFEKQRQNEAKAKMLASFGTLSQREYDYEQYQSISHYFRSHSEDGFSIDDITWNDLDMDRIFMAMNHAQSSAGEEYLYAALRKPLFDKEAIDERERLIRFMAENPEKRVDILDACRKMGRTRRISLTDYLRSFVNVPRSSLLYHLCPALLVVLAIITMIYQVSLGMMVMIGVFIYNVTSYFKDKSSIDSYFVSTAYIARIVKQAEKLASLDIPELEAYEKRLKEACAPLHPIILKAMFVGDPRNVSGGLMDSFMEYVNMIFHIDLIMFYSCLDLVKKNVDSIEVLLEIIGQLETAIAIASYREALPYYCVPTLENKSTTTLQVSDIYHPGLSEPVANSIDVAQCVLLTGSNASGKSTFLRTIALNAILAQTIHTCTATKMTMPFVRTMSSMSLKDDLEGGDSYYMVEIKALKRIMDETAKEAVEAPVLCFVDEVLRGTNTVERIAASSRILEQLSAQGAFVFAATHDIELTYILEKSYANYHFSEEVVGDDVSFSYILQDGRATTRNAIKLLGIMGYDDSVIQKAESTAKHFLETGEWTL